MSTTTLLTLEQFERLPDRGDVSYELSDGELIEKPMATYGHEVTKNRVIRLLFRYADEYMVGEAFAESQFALSPSCVRQPDAAFVRKEALTTADPHRILKAAPDLAVEVVSDGQRANELRRKIMQYLDAGVKVVWAIYPDLRIVAVYDHAGVKELAGEQVLEAPEIMPGFTVSVNQLFRGR